MASLRDGNDILMQHKEHKEEAAKESAKGIGDFSVSELLAQLEAKGKTVAIIEPGQEKVGATNELLDDRADLEDSDHAGEEPVQNGDQARTGTFGGAKLDGTIKEGY